MTVSCGFLAPSANTSCYHRRVYHPRAWFWEVLRAPGTSPWLGMLRVPQHWAPQLRSAGTVQCGTKAKTWSQRKVHKGKTAKQCMSRKLHTEAHWKCHHDAGSFANTGSWDKRLVSFFSVTKKDGFLHGIILRLIDCRLRAWIKSLMMSVERLSLAWASPRALLN